MNLNSLNRKLVVFGVFIRKSNILGYEGKSPEEIHKSRILLERELMEIQEAFLENQGALRQQYSEERMKGLEERLNRLKEAIAPDLLELESKGVS